MASSRRPSAIEQTQSTDSASASRRPSIDPSKLVPMDKASATPGSGDFNVVFIGAGGIMFGGHNEGPWNHSFRFEHKLGPRLKIVAVIDPAVEHAMSVLQSKCSTFVRSAYEGTRVFRSLDEFVKNMSRADAPRLIVVGSPPRFRGTEQPGRDIELQILKHFPGVPMFCEKPVATGPADEIPQAFAVAKRIAESGTVCSVGYMLRYLKAVQMMKQIIEDNGLTVMATIARFAIAYESIRKVEWWDKSKSHGPIIEQSTHLCDLSRYFGGEVDTSTVYAHALEWDEPAGKLSKLNIDENQIKPNDRSPRATVATWKYDSGAVGQLSHLLVLHDREYSCEVEVYADGYQMKLANPYQQPVLYIRRPGSDSVETHRFADDDPFFSEISVLVDNIEDIEENPETAQILSSYEDACKTYELTWAVRQASERSRKPRKEVPVEA